MNSPWKTRRNCRKLHVSDGLPEIRTLRTVVCTILDA